MNTSNQNQKHVVLPPIIKDLVATYIPWHAYVMLICEVPAGKVASIRDIMKCLAEAYGAEFPLERPRWDSEMRQTESYPYWRVVSERGHVLYSNKVDITLAKLQAEGIEIHEPNPEIDSVLIQDFKEKKFDFSCLKVSVLETDKSLSKKLLQRKNGTTAV